MRLPVSKILFVLIATIAAPIMGAGDRAQAGVITSGSRSDSIESQLFGGESLFKTCWNEGQYLLTELVNSVAESVASLADEDAPIGRLIGLARRTLANSAKSGLDATLAPASQLRVELGSPDCICDPFSATPPVVVSAYRADISARLPDPHLSALLRPPC